MKLECALAAYLLCMGLCTENGYIFLSIYPFFFTIDRNIILITS